MQNLLESQVLSLIMERRPPNKKLWGSSSAQHHGVSWRIITAPRGAPAAHTWNTMHASAHKSTAAVASSSLSTSGDTYSAVPQKA